MHGTTESQERAGACPDMPVAYFAAHTRGPLMYGAPARRLSNFYIADKSEISKLNPDIFFYSQKHATMIVLSNFEFLEFKHETFETYWI